MTLRRQVALDARRLRVRAWRDVSSVLAGAYRSAFRGNGLVFEELRDYAPGDDAAAIEWKASARLGRPIVKRMREERDLVLALLVDVSDSLRFGRGATTKLDAVVRTAAALAGAATRARDRVALALFSDRLHATLPPETGPRQLERLLRRLAASSDPESTAVAPGRGTDARVALDWAARTLPRGSLVVLISDGFAPDPGPSLAHCAHRHALLALFVRDPADDLPSGLAPVRVAGAEGDLAGCWRAPATGPRAAVLDRLRALWPPGRAAAVRPGRATVLARMPARDLRRRGVEVAQLPVGDRLIAALQHVLEKRARGGA
jgi:uncharacterized protein (DUF58 family)